LRNSFGRYDMITAYGDAETKRKAFAGGAGALLTKPIDFVTLRNAIDLRVEPLLDRSVEAMAILTQTPQCLRSVCRRRRTRSDFRQRCAEQRTCQRSDKINATDPKAADREQILL
jgi:hypothetical protein